MRGGRSRSGHWLGGSEDAGATHRDGLHDDAVTAGPRARRWRTKAAAHRHLAEHWHTHHAAVLLHGEGVHAAQTKAARLGQVRRNAAGVVVDAAGSEPVGESRVSATINNKGNCPSHPQGVL